MLYLLETHPAQTKGDDLGLRFLGTGPEIAQFNRLIVAKALGALANNGMVTSEPWRHRGIQSVVKQFAEAPQPITGVSRQRMSLLGFLLNPTAMPAINLLEARRNAVIDAAARATLGTDQMHKELVELSTFNDFDVACLTHNGIIGTIVGSVVEPEVQELHNVDDDTLDRAQSVDASGYVYKLDVQGNAPSRFAEPTIANPLQRQLVFVKAGPDGSLIELGPPS